MNETVGNPLGELQVDESGRSPLNNSTDNQHNTNGTSVVFENLSGSDATHVIIHNETLPNDVTDTKPPATPLHPPPTPVTPLSRDRGYMYQWDEAVHEPVIPVRCKNSNGELHKAKFGSGGRGRCIKLDNEWFTPSEFEAKCGRASSKDWKRSIRYGGRSINCLIEDSILQPHATSCTCAACCDDETVTGPIRLFVPYKRKKRQGSDSYSGLNPANKKQILNMNHKEGAIVVSASAMPAGFVQSLAQTSHAQLEQETIHLITADASGNLVAEPTVVMTPMQTVPKASQHQTHQHPQHTQHTQPNTLHHQAITAPAATGIINIDQGGMMHDHHHIQQLEDMIHGLMNQASQLKQMIEQVKQQSQASCNAALQQQRVQMEKEKQQALTALRIEHQMQLSRAIADERTQRDIAVQQAVTQVRAELETVTVVAEDSNKVAYTMNWGTATQADTTPQQHIENHMLQHSTDANKQKQQT